MATYFIRDCGHETLNDPWGKGENEALPGLCQKCKAARIGEVIEFTRFGKPPAVSRNHRDGNIEDGVSVYEVVNGSPVLVGWHFDFMSRDEYRGEGRITGWGSDGEPVVEILSVKKVKK